MPVLVNKETGLAEELAPDQAQSAIYAGTHHVPLVGPDGQLGSAPFQDAQQMVSTGQYAQPSPGQLDHMLRYADNAGTTGQVKSFAEGAAEASTFGLSTPLEIAAGANPEDIRMRRDINPKAHMAGQMTGLVGSLALPGAGEAGALKALGEGAEALTVGKAAEGVAQTFGQQMARGAVRLATEGAAFQAGDELSRHFEDPDRTVGMAAANIGMAALTNPIIGGALAGLGGIFKATKADELQDALNAASDYVKSSNEGLDLTPGVADKLEASPELKAAMVDNPEIQRRYQELINSNSHVGEKFLNRVDDLRGAVNEGAVSRLGFTPEEIEGSRGASANELGEKIQNEIGSYFEDKVKPVKEMYDKVNDNYSDAYVYPAMRKDMAEKITQFADAQGYAKAPSSTGYKVMSQLEEELPLQKTANDIRKYAENISNQLSDFEDSHLRRNVVGILRSVADDAVKTRVGEVEGADAVSLYDQARAAYADVMGDAETLADRLRPGKYRGPGGFLNNVKGMTPEDVLKRLSRTNDANLIGFLNEKMPQVAELIKKNQVYDVARKSVTKNGFSLGSFLDKMEELPPETREALLGPDTLAKLQGDRSILDKLAFTQNPSGTAKAASGFLRQTVGGLGGYALGAMMGPKSAFIMSMLGKSFSDVPDAVRLAFLRSIAAGKTPDAMAFRALVETAGNAFKSAATIEKGIRAALSGSGTFTINALSKHEQKQLEEAADTYQDNPEQFINTDNHLATYEPAHGAAQMAMISRAMQAVLAAKPKTGSNAILDAEIKPSKIEKANYQKTMQIVENPLTVLHYLKTGTLTPESLTTFKSVYPGLHQMMVEKMTNELIEMKSKGKTVPYRQRMALSMFMGMPLDSTMSNHSIAMNQPQPIQNPSTPGKSLKDLGKIATADQTMQQGRESARAMR